jgi:dipeptidyl aminopeptidase/acylaminoacyl peptidase
MHRSLTAAALLAAVLPAVAALPAQDSTSAARATPAPRAFTPADWYRVTTLSAPAVSPDGKLVAVTATTVRDSANKRHSEVWVVPAAGGEAMRYTAPGAESSNPRFSPDGRYLLFTSTRPGGNGSTWALRMDRPGGEAAPMEHAPPASATFPRDGRFAIWSDSVTPDSTADSTAKAKDPFEKMEAMARPPFGAVTRPVDPRRFDGRHVVDLSYKANGRGYLPGLRAARVWRPSQIWMQPLDSSGGRASRSAGSGGHAPGRAGSDRRQLTNARYSHRDAAVSPDGRWIAFVADTGLRPDSAVQTERDSIGRLPYDAARDEAERNDGDVFVLPVSGGEPRRVTRFAGSESDLAWSPDGKRISFVARPARTKSARLYTVTASGGEPVNVLGDWRYEPESYRWLPDGRISMSAAVGGRTALFTVAPGARRVTEVLGGRRRLSGFAYDAKRARVAYVATSANRPTELYVAGVDGRGERKLTSFNDSLNAQVAWSDAERFTYPSVGGLEIEGWIMKPFGYEPGRKYPLVLYIHGGPHSAYGENWFDEFQNLAGAGMMVLYTNPRGSAGYGADFTYATRGRWGAEDYQDLMKAVDIAAARPDVDSTRMGVTGGSYGGFMTAWITTKTNRFKAAQADRMISNWSSWYGASDAQGLTEFEFYGKPWDNPAMYDTLSPIRYVDRVQTPTLIVQSEEDYRTPMADAEQWFMALKKRGVPVEFVRYPRSNHDLSRTGEPWLLVDRLGRLRQWFGYWLAEGGVRATAAAGGTP